MIVDASTETYKKESLKKASTIKVCMYNRHTYELTVIPMAKHVLIQYKTLEFKIGRDDKDGYESIVQFLVNAIYSDLELSIRDNILYGEGFIYNDDFDESYLEVTRTGVSVFTTIITQKTMKEQLKTYLMPMRFLN